MRRSGLQICKRLANNKVASDSTWLVRISPISSVKLDFTLVLAKALCESDNAEMLKLSIGTFEQVSIFSFSCILIFLSRKSAVNELA